MGDSDIGIFQIMGKNRSVRIRLLKNSFDWELWNGNEDWAMGDSVFAAFSTRINFREPFLPDHLLFVFLQYTSYFDFVEDGWEVGGSHLWPFSA